MAGPLRIAVLASPETPGLQTLLRSPLRGSVFEIGGVADCDYFFVLDDRPISDSLRDSFPCRIIVMRDSDPTYDGDGGVLEALMRGEEETRCSATFANGSLLLLGPSFAVPQIARDARLRGDAGLLARYAALHREWMVAESWGPMMLRIVELLAAGTVIVVDGLVWVDGAPAPCLMGEAPSVCREPHSPINAGIPRSCPFIAERGI